MMSIQQTQELRQVSLPFDKVVSSERPSLTPEDQKTKALAILLMLNFSFAWVNQPGDQPGDLNN
ncbi:MAG: hypothetical protein JW769_00720 [Parachlamydiales bacterium]|nr:hypothetical protein [Parachlamydiales bacterium]